MCFTIDKDTSFHNSNEKTTCYKVVVKNRDKDGEEIVANSLIQGFPYEQGKLYTEPLFGRAIYRFQLVKSNPEMLQEVFHAFHSFRTLDAAIFEKAIHEDIWDNLLFKFVIAKCVIPPGTPYLYDPNLDHYASESIILEEILES